MQQCRRPRFVAVLVAFMIGGATSWATASTAPKWSASELADFADVIVSGRVESITGGWDPVVGTIYTYVVVDVDEVHKGFVGRGRLTVKQLGGMVAGRGLRVFDQPTFVVGESVLLYLEARPRDGSLYTAALWQGKWTIEGDVAVRFEPPGHRSAYPVDRQMLREVRGLGARLDADPVQYVNTSPIEATNAVARPYTLQGPYRYLVNPVIDVQAGGQPDLAGGGIAQIQAAIAKWNAVGASFRYSLGSTSIAPRCTTESLDNNRVTITFNDPCGEISNLGGTLAFAGSYFVDGEGGTVNGQPFARATDGFLVNNDGSSALSTLRQPGCFEDVQLHELGHVLGLDHTSDPDAIMFPTINNACGNGPRELGSDDRNGMLFIYPPAGVGGGGGATPPSSAPNNISVSVSGTASLTVSFSQVSSATSYRLDFRQTAGGPILATLTTPSTSTVIPLPSGTSGTFNVTVTGLNSVGAGPSSPAVSFTVGGGGGSGPCSTTPVSPSVSGTLINGVATVSWAPVPGATFYVLSAGTTPGGTNLSPTANIGPVLSVEATGLPPGFTAWVRVVAGNACGQSAPSDFFLQ